MNKADIKMSNARAKTMLPYENPDECCYYCQYYQEDPETQDAVCTKYNHQTICIAYCGSWERKM